MGILEGEGTLCSTCGRPHTKRARQDIMKGPLPPDNWWSESMDAKFHLEIFTESSDLVPHFTEDCSDKLRKQLDLPTLFLSGANNRRSSLRSRPSASFNQFECCVDEKAVLIKMNKPTKDQWQALSPVIQRLYLDEGQTFKKVAEYLHKYHDFNPT
jgi:hypothetical protein